MTSGASLFGYWSEKVADAAKVQKGQLILDVACGTGSLARETATRVKPSGVVSGIDASPGMIAVANELSPELDWHEGVAESLPFSDNTYDIAVCQFGLMFFKDRQQAIQEMLRVLIPGGRLVVCVWDSLSNNPAYAASVALLNRLAGQQAADALSAPFDLGDTKQLGNLFTQAGVDQISISTLRGQANFPSVSAMMQSDLRGWLPLLGVNLEEYLIQKILEEAETALGSYVTERRRMEFASSAHIVTAVKT